MGNKIQFNEKRWKEEFSHVSRSLDLGNYISESEKHLDLGCGVGTFTWMLAKRFPGVEFLGLNIDEGKIGTARANYDLPNLEFVCSESIPGAYDSITATYVLHEIGRDRKVLEKLEDMRKSLNDCGKILIYDFRKVPKQRFRKHYERGGDGWEGTFEEEYEKHNKWTYDELEKLCDSAGLTVERGRKVGGFWMALVSVLKDR